MRRFWRRGLAVLGGLAVVSVLGLGAGAIGCGGVSREVAENLTTEECPPYLDAMLRIENQSSYVIWGTEFRFECRPGAFELFDTFEEGYHIFEPPLNPGEARDLPIRYVPTGHMAVELLWSADYLGWFRTCRFLETWSSDDAPWPPVVFHVDDTSGPSNCDPPP